MTTRPFCALAPATLALACLAAGCSPSKVTVTGTILQDNQPMIVPEDVYVTISFSPEDTEKRSSQSAKFDPKTGKYSADIPSGRYKTKVVIALPRGKGQPPVPLPQVESPDFHDLTSDKVIDIHVPAFPKGK